MTRANLNNSHCLVAIGTFRSPLAIVEVKAHPELQTVSPVLSPESPHPNATREKVITFPFNPFQKQEGRENNKKFFESEEGVGAYSNYVLFPPA